MQFKLSDVAFSSPFDSIQGCLRVPGPGGPAQLGVQGAAEDQAERGEGHRRVHPKPSRPSGL